MILAFRVKLSQKDWVHAQGYRLALAFPRWLQFAAGLLCKLVALGCFWWMLERGATIATGWGFLIFTALGLQLLFLPLSRIGQAQREYRKRSGDILEETISLAETGAVIKDARGLRGLPWGHVAFAADTPRGLLFWCPGRAPLFWLPQRAFDEGGTRDQVRLLLETAGVRVREVR